PHMIALRPFGLDVLATSGWYQASVSTGKPEELSVVLTERGDTVTENALMAAARHDGVTTIRNASPNYMVQDLCFYLELLGVQIEFMEIELACLAEMWLKYIISPEYPAANGRTRLVDVTVYPSQLRAPIDKIHPMPFPGLNIDNLPFFAVIAACANGTTTIH